MYYSGWSRAGATPTTYVTVHHPQGDIKKISIGYNDASSYGDYWRVVWSDGITEPGSSGAPLFNENHKLIGQLYNGSSSCSNQDGSDNFGKFSVSWDYGSTSTTRLKDWLDPYNSGVTEIDNLPPLLVPENYATIGAGLEAATSGLAVEVSSGTYTENSDLTIPAGVTLDMTAGGTLRMANNTQMVVNGILKAKNYTFTASNTSWKGIRFNSGSDGEIYNCHLAKAGYPYYLYIYNASPNIEFNTLDQWAGAYEGIYVTGSTANPEIYANDITINYTGVRFQGYARGSYDYNRVYVTNNYDPVLYVISDAWVNAEGSGGNLFRKGRWGISADGGRVDVNGTASENDWCTTGIYDLDASDYAEIYADDNNFPGGSPLIHNDGTSTVSADYAGNSDAYCASLAKPSLLAAMQPPTGPEAAGVSAAGIGKIAAQSPLEQG